MRNALFTFAPGIAKLFFSVSDSSILPVRLPTCTGSKGAVEDTGSVNWGWGSHIILGFQLGDSFGSVSWKKWRQIIKRKPYTCHSLIQQLATPTVGVGDDLKPARDDASENSSQNTVMPSICKFLCANVVGWCTLTLELSSSVSSQ